MLAQTGMKEKEKALLNYSEAYYIFKQFGDDKQRAVCLANIGVLMMQKQDFKMAFESFSLSCEIQEAQIEALNGTIEQRTDLASAKFIMACRQF